MDHQDVEKNVYVTEAARGDEHAVTDNDGHVLQKGYIAKQEGADVYGDIETAEHYGYVQRGLKSRHIQFIALGGTIGTGYFLGIGTALADAGPASLFMGYVMCGIAVYGMMQSLGEMTTWLPLPGAIPQYCARYVDPALGFAAGFNNWYGSALTLCAEISAASLVIQFWNTSISQAAWISIIIVVVLCLNIFAVSIYGEAEFIFASIKIITIVGLLLLALIIDLGGAPKEDRIGFAYWKAPYQAFIPYIGTGATGRFAGWFSTLVNAAFAYGGVETVAVAAGEAANPRKNIPKAIKRVFWRIIIFYGLGTLLLGMICPANDKALTDGGAGAASSPWVIAIVRAGIPALPSIINAVILTSASSSANAFLYIGSRYLFALAQNKQAPKFLLYCTKKGVPLWCVLITASFSLLTYMTVSSGSSVVFQWFQTITATNTLWVWVSVCISYIRFRKALIAQGVNRDHLVFKSPYQPYTAYAALTFFLIILLFNGFAVFTKGNWSAQSFVTAYIGAPIYIGSFLIWKLVKKTKFVKPEEADIQTGKAALDAEIWPEEKPRNFLERIWFWLT